MHSLVNSAMFRCRLRCVVELSLGGPTVAAVATARNEPHHSHRRGSRCNELDGTGRNGTGTGFCERLVAAVLGDCRMILCWNVNFVLG